MPYFDCYPTPVPRANRARCQALARLSSLVVREHGALRVTGCWLDEGGPDAETYPGSSARQPSDIYGTFAAAAGARPEASVVPTWIEWPDRGGHEEGMARVTSDPRLQFDGRSPLFSGTRLLAGGLIPMLEDRADG